MKRLHTFGIITTFIVSMLAMIGCDEKNYICTSPDNNIALFADSGKCVITYKNQKIFAVEKFGYDGCAAPNFNFVQSITDEYTMLAGKRSK